MSIFECVSPVMHGMSIDKAAQACYFYISLIRRLACAVLTLCKSNPERDEYYICDGQQFVWDREKHEINYNLHGITYEEAATIFTDDDTLIDPDDVHSYNEKRFTAIGLSLRSNLLFVCHCEREDSTIIRIISARKAEKHEERRFEEESLKPRRRGGV